jgi:hypothetical protein
MLSEGARERPYLDKTQSFCDEGGRPLGNLVLRLKPIDDQPAPSAASGCSEEESFNIQMVDPEGALE